MGMGANALTSAPPVLPTRVLAGDRSGCGDDDPEQLADELVPVVAAQRRREHREVRAHVRAGHRLAEDVGAFEVRPLGARVAGRTCGAGGVELGGPRGAQPGAGVGREGVRVHREPPVVVGGERGALADALLDEVDERGGRLGGRAGVEGRLRVVLDGELDHLRHLRSVHAVEQDEAPCRCRSRHRPR